MKEIKSYVVPWLEDAKLYSLADLDQAWSQPELARMMINECPMPPSEPVVEAVLDAARRANRYPGTSPELRKKIADLYGLAPDQVYLAGGSSECIDAMVRVFMKPDDEIIISNPTFSLYEVRARVAGGKPVVVHMTPEFEYDVDAMLGAITAKTKVIIACSPNNPTGNFMEDGDLMRLVETGIPIFLDEAYLEFQSSRSSKASLIADYPNVVVNRTMSKAFGLAGIRFGYLLGSSEVIGYFNKVQLPWSATLMSLAAANAALDDKEGLEKRVAHNNATVERFVSELNAIPGMKTFPAVGNFLMVDATDTGKSDKEIVDYAMDRGVMIKTMGTMHGRNGFFRITIGTEEENQKLLDILKEFLQA